MKTKINKNFFQSKQFLVVALLIAILFAVGFGRYYLRHYQSLREIEQLEQEAMRLEAEKLSLVDLLDYVQSEAYVEEEARRNLQYQKPGEEVYVVTDSVVQKEIKHENQKTNLQLWWEYFFAPEINK